MKDNFIKEINKMDNKTFMEYLENLVKQNIYILDILSSNKRKRTNSDSDSDSDSDSEYSDNMSSLVQATENCNINNSSNKKPKLKR